jgi:hypothetical protein
MKIKLTNKTTGHVTHPEHIIKAVPTTRGLKVWYDDGEHAECSLILYKYFKIEILPEDGK